jgi:DNA-binding transcriptional LysR family regulator
VELRHLRDFVAVADELSFTRAAKKLHVAQPSLTQQIKLLEQELGVRLLNRIKGRVSLTEAGKVFLADSRRVIALSEDSVRAVQHFNRSETKQLKIGYVASLHYHLLPATLAAFQRAYPEVALNLFDMTCAQQLEALDADKIDLGFIGLRESLAGTNLQAEAVAFYEILVALPKETFA